MPNPEQIRKSQERRAARAGKKAEHEDAAVQQEHELAALSDRLRGKTDPSARTNEAGLRTDQIGMAQPVDEDGDDDEIVPASSKAKAGTRAEQKLATQKAAAKQAEADLRATVNPLPERDEHDLSWYRANNTEPPLHVLNAIARRADNVQKDDARIAATAAGKAAYDALTEHRSTRSHESRFKTMDKSIADARAKSQVGAADPDKK